jgi:phospholipid/cholesterol/gamma-HCH transport system substrate-binding protein
MSAEAKVGFFVVIGVVMLFLLTTQVNTFKNMNEEGYTVVAYVDDSTGLGENTKVKMNGIDIGWVTSLEIMENFVSVKMFIKNVYRIPKDSEIVLVQENLLGSRIVLIKRGKSHQYLSENGIIKKFQVYSSFEETSDSIFKTSEEFRKLAEDLRKVVDQQNREEFSDALSNLNNVLLDIRVILAENRSGVKNSIDNIEIATNRLPAVVEALERTLKKYEDVGETLDIEITEVSTYAKSLISEINETVAENRQPLNKTINSVDSFFTKGQESIDKIDKIISSISEAQLQFAMRTEINTFDSSFSSYVDIAYLPNPQTYYLFGITTTEDRTQENSGNLHESGDTLFSVMYGKRYSDWLFRAGLIESQGGVGVDKFFSNDKMKITAEIFDFNAVNNIRNENANLRTNFRYRIYDHIDFFVGGNNLLNDERGVTFGVGFYFLDNDLKSMIGLAGASSF